jgi:tRNA (guanine-N7-)-methyltransferase
LVLTEYEAKFVEKGNNIHRVEVVIGETAIAAHRETKRMAQIKDQAADTSTDVSEPSTEPTATSEG